jgi:hypothetical protein
MVDGGFLEARRENLLRKQLLLLIRRFADF